MNKKGIIGFELAIYLTAGFFFVVLPIAGKMGFSTEAVRESIAPKFKQKKAVEKCAAGYHTEDYCKDKVAKMDKKEILAYIRDDDMTQGNKGFVN